MNVRNVCKAVPYIKSKLFKSKAVVNSSIAPLTFPRLLTNGDFRSLVTYHQEDPNLVYVFHMPKHRLKSDPKYSLAVGELDFDYRQIAEKVINHPDIMVERHEDVIGGHLRIEPLLNGKQLKIRIDGWSDSYGFRDPKLPFNAFMNMAMSDVAGFRIAYKDKPKFLMNNDIGYSMIIENRENMTFSPDQMPCVVEKSNFRSFAMHQQRFNYRFVYHLPTGTMVVGDYQTSHLKIAEKIFAEPKANSDMFREMVGGNISVEPELIFTSGNKNPITKIRMDGISELYGIRDAWPAFKSVIEWARSEFKVVSRQWGTYTSYALYYSLNIEEKLPLK